MCKGFGQMVVWDILLYMVTTLILIMHDVGHLLGTGIMPRPMGVPLVIAISVNVRGTTEIP